MAAQWPDPFCPDARWFVRVCTGTAREGRARQLGRPSVPSSVFQWERVAAEPTLSHRTLVQWERVAAEPTLSHRTLASCRRRGQRLQPSAEQPPHLGVPDLEANEYLRATDEAAAAALLRRGAARAHVAAERAVQHAITLAAKASVADPQRSQRLEELLVALRKSGGGGAAADAAAAAAEAEEAEAEADEAEQEQAEEETSLTISPGPNSFGGGVAARTVSLNNLPPI